MGLFEAWPVLEGQRAEADGFEARAHPLWGDERGDAQFYFGGFCGVCVHQGEARSMTPRRPGIRPG